MLTQILLVSGASPRYFAGFGVSQSGKPFVIATHQPFQAKHYSTSQANVDLDALKSAYPLAQLSVLIGA